MICLVLLLCLWGTVTSENKRFSTTFKCKSRATERYPSQLNHGQVNCIKTTCSGYSICRYECENKSDRDNFNLPREWSDNCIMYKSAPCSIHLAMSEQFGSTQIHARSSNEPLKITVTLSGKSPTITATKNMSVVDTTTEIPIFCNGQGENQFDTATIAFDNTADETNLIEVKSIKILEGYSNTPTSEFWYGLPLPLNNKITIPEHSYRSNMDQVQPERSYHWETSALNGVNPELRNLYHFQQSNESYNYYGINRELFWTTKRDEAFSYYYGVVAEENSDLISKEETEKKENDYLKSYQYKSKGWADLGDDDAFIARTINGYRTKGLKILSTDSEILEKLQFEKLQEEVPKYTNRYVRQKLTRGQLFYVDASAFGELKNYGGEAPILVLELSGNQLKPLFIQTSPQPDSYIFTPQMDKWTWKLGMRIFEGANSIVQTVTEHLFESHFIPEVFATAAYKSLPYNHPIYKLLYPHIQGVISINTVARLPEEYGGGLIGKGGFVQRATHLSYENQFEYIHNALETWDLDEINLPVFLEKYGLTDDKLPLPFVLRDDGMKYWNLITEYVSNVIKYSFSDDSAVKSDAYIAEFISQMKYGMKQAPKVQDWFERTQPENSKDELIKLLTIIIWETTVGHNMEHFPVWDFAGNPNIAPWKLEKPIPKHKPESISESEYKSYLPRPDNFKDQMNLAFGGTTVMAKDETEYISNFSDIYGRTKLAKFANNFRESVQLLENEIKAEHVDYPIPYDYLLPSRLTARVDN